MTNKTLQSSKVDRDSTQLINFNQRRVTNAADAINAQDYVTLNQLNGIQDKILQGILTAIGKPSTTAKNKIPHALVWSTGTSTSVPNSTVTALKFDIAYIDTSSFWNNAQPTRLTAPAPGDYLILYSTYGQDGNGSPTGFAISAVCTFVTRNVTYLAYKNGAAVHNVSGGANQGEFIRSDTSTSILFDMGSEPLFDILTLAAGDYIEITAFQLNGYTMTLTAGACVIIGPL